MSAKPTKRKSSALTRSSKRAAGLNYHAWSGGIASLLEEARRQSARHVNAILTATCWEIGRRIVEFVQQGETRAEYGDEVLGKLSRDLTKKFGRGFGPVNLNEMKRFFLTWPTETIFQTLSEKLVREQQKNIFQTVSEKSLVTIVGLEIFQTVSGKSSAPVIDVEPATSSQKSICQTASGKSPAKRIRQTASAKSEICGTASYKLPRQTSATPSRNSEADFSIYLDTLSEAFPLSWSHYVRLLSVEKPEARKFYETESLRGGWSVRQLDRQVSTLFYERTALAKNKAKLLTAGAKARPEDAVSVEEEIKSPYVLKFLNLRDDYAENDLEDALVRHLEAFLLELGNDFTFVARQKKIRVGKQWYRIDLLLFHRRLRCLFIFDLKLGRFTHADAGQIHPVRYYERVPLRLRSAKSCGRQFLHRLHQRPAPPHGRTSRRQSSFHCRPASAPTRLLRSLSQSCRRHAPREISQNGLGQTLFERSVGGLSHGVNLYVNYAAEHLTLKDENPPVGLILCSEHDEAVARYSMGNVTNKILAAQYKLALPNPRLVEKEIEKTRRILELRAKIGYKETRPTKHFHLK